MKKKIFPVICRSVPVDIEPPFGLVRMFFDMSLTNSRKGCMTMVKVKYDKKVDCMQNYAKQSVKKSIKESSNVQRRVFLIQLEIGHWRGTLTLIDLQSRMTLIPFLSAKVNKSVSSSDVSYESEVW
jgi:hypothetical protein